MVLSGHELAVLRAFRVVWQYTLCVVLMQLDIKMSCLRTSEIREENEEATFAHAVSTISLRVHNVLAVQKIWNNPV